MKQLLQSRSTRSICYALVAALLSSLAPTPLAKPAQAQLMPKYSVGVVDFINESGVQGDLLARLATDAVVVEMGKTSRYDVGTTRTQMRKEMEELDLRPPLDKIGIVRLGERLECDAMLQGSIKSVQLAGSGPTRRAQVTLVAQMLDQASGEVINGSVMTGSSSARVGYVADDDSLITEAINNAAFLVVKTMVDYIIPEATVQMNIKESEVMLNKGARDGIKQGMRMIVLRQREIIGFIEIRTVSATDSTAKVLKSMRGIQPEDKVRAIYEMPTVTSSLKQAPLPSGAPSGGGGKKGTFSKIAKVLLGAAIVFGIASLFRSGRGNEDAPSIAAAAESPTSIVWDPTKYGHGQNVLEYQVMRDEFTAGAQPVMSIRDPSQIDAGRAELYGLYGTAAGPTVNYYRLDANPATTYTESSFAVPAEPYGTTHRYQVRVIYRLTASGGTSSTSTGTKYYYSDVSNLVVATAIEPVRNVDVVSPAYDRTVAPPEILISDLQQGDINFEWLAKDGADVYYMTVEPVIPGTGPTWKSPTIYGTSVTVELPTAVRTELATLLSNSAYADKTMKWRVFCRNQSDTSGAWRQGEENRFVIGGTPPSSP